jgi:hypothetical protein
MTDAPIRRLSRRETVRVSLLFLACTWLFTYPLGLDPAGSVLPIGPDGSLFMWTLAWDTHAFLHQPLRLFDANIYHPHPNTLAYSENLVGSAFLAAPILWLTDNPVLALNIVSLVTCLLCGIGAYLLARRVGLEPPAAFVAGFIFAFSPPRFFRTAQLHLGAVQWIPFGLAFLHAYMDGGRRRDLLLAAGFFSLQALTSGHGAAFMTLAYVAFLLYRFVSGDPVAPLRRLKDLGVWGVALLVPAVLIYLPYRRAQVEVGLRRTLDNWVVTPESFIASPSHLHQAVTSFLTDAPILETASAFLFPGVLPLVFALVGVVALAVSAGSVSRRGVLFYALLLLVCVWLSIGPPLGLWPYVYDWPGLSLVRVPSRFTILGMLALAIVAGGGVQAALARRRVAGVVLVVPIVLVLTAEFAAFPMPVTPMQVSPPAADRWLADVAGPVAVAEVPIADPTNAGAFERRQTEYMLHSTAHWKKTVHGYSGIRPPDNEQLYLELRNFPDERSLEALGRFGVTHIVVHTALYPPGEWDLVRERITGVGPRLRLTFSSGPDRVYELVAR